MFFLKVSGFPATLPDTLVISSLHGSKFQRMTKSDLTAKLVFEASVNDFRSTWHLSVGWMNERIPSIEAFCEVMSIPNLARRHQTLRNLIDNGNVSLPASAKFVLRQIDVFSGRPLSDATVILQDVLNQVITYEDPLWDNPNETIELFKEGPVIPKPHQLRFQYTVDDSETVILALLDQYHCQIGRTQFELLSTTEGIYSVVPVKRQNKQGKFISNASVLDTKISLSVRDTSYTSIMAEIESILAPDIAGFAQPLQSLRRLKGSVDWKNKDARSCINEIFNEISKYHPRFGFSWELRRAPDAPQGILNVRRLLRNEQLTNFELPWRVRVEATRPLSHVLKNLETDLGQTITYEDPPLRWSGDLMRDRHGVTQRPRGGILEFHSGLYTAPAQVIQSCLTAYHGDSTSTGKFKITKSGAIFHAIPTESKTEEGILKPHKSILDTPITVLETNRPSIDILQTICMRLAQSSGRRVVLGEFSQLERSILQKASKKSVHLVNQLARTGLTDFVKEIDNDLSWQFLFDPKSKNYVLNIHSIGR